jgi:NADH dehydrogenase FAD-containing subunit
LISPTELYYNGVAPGVLSNRYPAGFGEIKVDCHLNKAKGMYIKEIVEKIDIKDNTVHLSDHASIDFDYLSINIGGRVPTGQILGSSVNSFPIRPIEKLWEFKVNLLSLIKQAPTSVSIAIVGGGAAGVEIAGNIKHFIQSQGISPNITLHTRGTTILPQFSISASKKVLKSFKKREIGVKLQSNVIKIQKNKLTLENNEECFFDLCVLATGFIPNKVASNGSLITTGSGELVINSFLQSKSVPHVFATGDCSYFEAQPLWKSGYHAINQGPVLLKNMIALSKGSPLQEYKPSKRIITALNLGGGTGLLILGNRSLLGKLSFRVKDVIEKRYINSYNCK